MAVMTFPECKTTFTDCSLNCINFCCLMNLKKKVFDTNLSSLIFMKYCMKFLYVVLICTSKQIVKHRNFRNVVYMYLKKLSLLHSKIVLFFRE